MATALDLSDIVDITVTISPVLSTRSTFNHGLIIGTSTVIPTTERLREYTSTKAMIADGFTLTSPEYLAATLYFSQSPAPKILWVGVQNIATSTPETPLVAVAACRMTNSDWYACMVCGVADADSELIASYIEAAIPSSAYLYTSTNTAALTTATTPVDIFSVLRSLDYSRSFGLYSTTTPNAVAALLGVAMGLNTGLANSAYTLKFKSLVGVSAEPLTQTQVTSLENKNGNVYVAYAGDFTIMEQGTMANGQFFDEIINIDMLVNNIQLNVMDLLISNVKVPLTDAGQTQIMNVINTACATSATIGFLAPGIWDGVTILNLTSGKSVALGYLVQSQAVSTLTTAQRVARTSPPIYVAITEAGAVHSVAIGIYVQR